MDKKCFVLCFAYFFKAETSNEIRTVTNTENKAYKN